MDINSGVREFLDSLTGDQRKLLVRILQEDAGQPVQEDNKPKNIKEEVTNVLMELGIPANLKGFRCLTTAITLAYHDPKVLEGGITKVMYPTVAEEIGTTPSRVERAIRHAIEVAWVRGDFDTQHRIFKNSVSPEKGKPANHEFISAVLLYIGK